MNQENKINELLGKLRSPLTFEFICNNILKLDEIQTNEILNDLVEQGIIEEKNKTYQIKKLK
jgi:hypothetical protein